MVQRLIQHRDKFKKKHTELNLRQRIHLKYGRKEFLETHMAKSYGVQQGYAVEIRKLQPQKQHEVGEKMKRKEK
jgi:hypothetical protein